MTRHSRFSNLPIFPKKCRQRKSARHRPDLIRMRGGQVCAVTTVAIQSGNEFAVSQWYVLYKLLMLLTSIRV